MKPTIEYCKNTGKAKIFNYPDGVVSGLDNKFPTQITIPLGSRDWRTLVTDGKFKLYFKDEDQLSELIERLIILRELKEGFTHV